MSSSNVCRIITISAAAVRTLGCCYKVMTKKKKTWDTVWFFLYDRRRPSCSWLNIFILFKKKGICPFFYFEYFIFIFYCILFFFSLPYIFLDEISSSSSIATHLLYWGEYKMLDQHLVRCLTHKKSWVIVDWQLNVKRKTCSPSSKLLRRLDL